MVAFGKLSSVTLAMLYTSIVAFPTDNLASGFKFLGDKVILSPQNLISEAEESSQLNLPGDKPVPGGSPISQCDTLDKQLLDLQSIVITPNPPIRGENLTFIAKGFLGEEIVDGAYVNVEVRYGFIKLIDQSFDLCEEITKVNMTCPISKGEQVVMKEVEIPNEVPPGRYTVVARAYTTNDEFITCLSAAIEFPSKQ